MVDVVAPLDEVDGAFDGATVEFVVAGCAERSGSAGGVASSLAAVADVSTPGAVVAG